MIDGRNELTSLRLYKYRGHININGHSTETLAFLGFPIDRRKTNDQLPVVTTLEDALQLHFRDFVQATINSRIIDIIKSTE